MVENVLCQNLVRPDTAVVAPETSVRDTLRLLRARDADSVVAVRTQMPVGIFTERDAISKVLGFPDRLTAPLSRVMRPAQGDIVFVFHLFGQDLLARRRHRADDPLQQVRVVVQRQEVDLDEGDKRQNRIEARVAHIVVQGQHVAVRLDGPDELHEGCVAPYGLQHLDDEPVLVQKTVEALFQYFAGKIDEKPFARVDILGNGVDAVGQNRNRGLLVRRDDGDIPGLQRPVQQFMVRKWLAEMSACSTTS